MSASLRGPFFNYYLGEIHITIYKSHGQLNPYIDVTLVKDLGISYGLEKVYNTFDVDHESRAKIKTYLSKVVHNCVLTELGKESTAVGAKSALEAYGFNGSCRYY